MKIAIKIVDLPKENDDFPIRFLYVYQRVYRIWGYFWCSPRYQVVSLKWSQEIGVHLWTTIDIIGIGMSQQWMEWVGLWHRLQGRRLILAKKTETPKNKPTGRITGKKEQDMNKKTSKNKSTSGFTQAFFDFKFGILVCVSVCSVFFKDLLFKIQPILFSLLFDSQELKTQFSDNPTYWMWCVYNMMCLPQPEIPRYSARYFTDVVSRESWGILESAGTGGCREHQPARCLALVFVDKSMP